MAFRSASVSQREDERLATCASTMSVQQRPASRRSISHSAAVSEESARYGTSCTVQVVVVCLYPIGGVYQKRCANTRGLQRISGLKPLKRCAASGCPLGAVNVLGFRPEGKHL